MEKALLRRWEYKAILHFVQDDEWKKHVIPSRREGAVVEESPNAKQWEADEILRHARDDRL
ncbi:MAG: hypothetical protein K5753_04495 [Clostridia bacterium]|nr:hypothetical protein [Clostridia bacterium]